ncbi:ATP-binding response regulator [Roseimaritima ulvae]|uniref:Response regulator MprA n=1 Tax=Roseimaritima ulvae TaxID=980254 RepID=A0A5B9QMT6_9BACT|nr:ATP-binding protein [Roseimaritima ulvae]QEG38326.1 Response regulator MprA [Roseimaritima ulvae]
MPKILIVDDNPADQEIAARILCQDNEYQIEFIDSPAEAPSRIAADRPDVVLTDLYPANQQGLQLVSRLHAECPELPVILMTDRGDEETAVEALHCGASSYVPKRLLERYLARTVRRLIDVSRDQRSRVRLLGSMKQNRATFFLKNDLEMIPTLINYFQEGMSHMGLGDESDRLRVSVALEEAISNAIHHGNLEVDSHLREHDESRYYACIRERQSQSPYREREVEIKVSMSETEAVFAIRDEGPGFDISALPDPTIEDNLENASGRGILLMRAFMDDVFYNDIGNLVTMTKRRGE